VRSVKAPEASGRTPRDELPQMIGEMAAQQVGDKVTGSRKCCARGGKRVEGRECRRSRLLSGETNVRIDPAKCVAERRHGGVGIRLHRWVAAWVKQAAQRARAQSGPA